MLSIASKMGNYIHSDHSSYSVPSPENWKKKFLALQDKLERRDKMYKLLSRKYIRLKRKAANCQGCEKYKSQLDSELTIQKKGRFNTNQLTVLNGLMAVKKKGREISQEMKKFAKGLFYYSPKAYNHVGKFFTLPHLLCPQGPGVFCPGRLPCLLGLRVASWPVNSEIFSSLFTEIFSISTSIPACLFSLPGRILHEDYSVVSRQQPGAHPYTLTHVGVAVLLPLPAQVEVGAG